VGEVGKLSETDRPQNEAEVLYGIRVRPDERQMGTCPNVELRDLECFESREEKEYGGEDLDTPERTAIGLGFTEVQVEILLEAEIDLAVVCTDMEYALERSGKSLVELIQILGVDDLVDLAEWMKIGRHFAEARDHKYFLDPRNSHAIGGFLAQQVPLGEALEWVVAWDEGRFGQRRYIEEPFLFFQLGVSIEEVERLMALDPVEGYWSLVEFVRRNISVDETMEWLIAGFRGCTGDELVDEDRVWCFQSWWERGFDPFEASEFILDVGTQTRSELLLECLDALDAVGVPISVHSAVNYLGLNAEQILWLIDNDLNTEHARTLVWAGLPIDCLKEIHNQVVNSVDHWVLNQFVWQECFIEVIQDESGPLILDVMRRLSDEKPLTVENASLLCFTSQGLNADEVVHWARLTEDRSVVDEWISAGFSPSEALRWVKGGVTSPLIARRRTDAGIPPPQATSTTQDL
jgi:hypothetical protein